jgi:hypothetical protein
MRDAIECYLTRSAMDSSRNAVVTVVSPSPANHAPTDHDPSVCLKDVLTRLPTHSADDIAKFLPLLWRPANDLRFLHLALR